MSQAAVFQRRAKALESVLISIKVVLAKHTALAKKRDICHNFLTSL